MLGSQMNSQGDAVPMGVRVFSTMNSSGPFAFAMMRAMVYVMAATHRVRWVAAALGFFSLALSLVRSTWGGWVIALLIQLIKSNNKVRVRAHCGEASQRVDHIFLTGAVGPRFALRARRGASRTWRPRWRQGQG
jgi:hypothetical protein